MLPLWKYNFFLVFKNNNNIHFYKYQFKIAVNYTDTP